MRMHATAHQSSSGRTGEKRVEHIDSDHLQTLERLDALARIMDSAITIPGTRVTLGVDAALGLVPVVGDAISGLISTYLILEARRLGASKFLLARMSGNAVIDTVVGSIPLVGDVFDVAYRSNRKNVDLLRRHLEKKTDRTSSPTGDGKTIDATYTVKQ